jgi:predicted DNA-binding transcriptional regulator YafY
MRRADRLFQIVQHLRRRRSVTTAKELARRLEVSERTIYRDVTDLMLSGVPIEGEAGVGYMLRHYDLPPLMFSRDEIEALVLGARIVETWTDPNLARAAADALSKIEAALPESISHYVDGTTLVAPRDHYRALLNIDFAELRRAVRDARKIRFDYTNENGAKSSRTVQPLWLAFYGPIWVLAAWCELRMDYRAFRPDRMECLEILDETFERRAGDSLPGWMTLRSPVARPQVTTD